MKKIILLTFLVLLFASCNNDDNPTSGSLTFEPNLLLKGWSYETIQWDGTLYSYDHNPDCYRDFFGFRNNQGQVYQFEETYFTNSYCTNNQTVLRWEPVGNHINFYFGKAKIDVYEIITLTENTFVYAIDRDIDNDSKKEHLIISTIPYDPNDSYGTKTNKAQKLKTFPVKLQILAPAGARVPLLKAKREEI